MSFSSIVERFKIEQYNFNVEGGSLHLEFVFINIPRTLTNLTFNKLHEPQ